MEGALALPRALPSQRRSFHWHHSGSSAFFGPGRRDKEPNAPCRTSKRQKPRFYRKKHTSQHNNTTPHVSGGSTPSLTSARRFWKNYLGHRPLRNAGQDQRGPDDAPSTARLLDGRPVSRCWWALAISARRGRVYGYKFIRSFIHSSGGLGN